MSPVDSVNSSAAMINQLHYNRFLNAASLHLRDESYSKAVEGNVSHVEFVQQPSPHVALISLLKIWIVAPLQTLFLPLNNFFLQPGIQGGCPVSVPFAMEADGVVLKINVIDQVYSGFRQANALARGHFERAMKKLSMLCSAIQTCLNLFPNLLKLFWSHFFLGFWFNSFNAKIGSGVHFAETSFNRFTHYRAQKPHLSSGCVDVDLLASPLHKFEAKIPGDMDRVVNVVHVKECQKESVIMHSLFVGSGSRFVSDVDKIEQPVFEVAVVAYYLSLLFLNLHLQAKHLGFGFAFRIINPDFGGLVNLFSVDTVLPSNPVVRGPFAFVNRCHNQVSHGVTTILNWLASVTQCHRKIRHLHTDTIKSTRLHTFAHTYTQSNSTCGTTAEDRSLYWLGVYASVPHGVTDAMALVQRAFGFAETALHRALLGLRGSGWAPSGRQRLSSLFSCWSLELIGIGIKWARGFAACFGSGSLGSAWLQRGAYA